MEDRALVESSNGTLTHAPAAVGELERALGKIRGVVASRVAYDDDGNVETVHVLGASGRSAKRIVRDVEAVFAAQFGITLDHRKISVAQVDMPVDEWRDLKRPLLETVRVERGRTKLTVGVVLAGAGDMFTGEASGPPSPEAASRLAAVATLKALSAYVGECCRFELRDLVPFELGGRQGVVAAIAMQSRGAQDEQLLGCAFSDTDPIETVIKACLSSINRRLMRVAWADA